jgi:hypothetical protein
MRAVGVLLYNGRSCSGRVPDDATGTSDCDHIGRQIPGNAAAGPYHRIGPDGDTGTDDGAAS